MHMFCFSVALGSPVWIPGADMAALGKSHAVVGVPHIQWRKMGMDVGSGPVFLSRKRRIGADVSSGLIFHKEKKKRRNIILLVFLIYPEC